MSASRPNRSDVRLSLEEETKIEEETREYFDGIAVKRHTKPERSDYSSQYSDPLSNSNQDIPEYVKFQHLESEDPKKLVYNGSEAPEDYVETEYYKDLNGVDKQHHTVIQRGKSHRYLDPSPDMSMVAVYSKFDLEVTGTGFIRVENTDDDCFKLTPDTAASHLSSKGNPATNDWIPAASDETTLTSDKPNRS